ncbi:hypothetical protein CMO91_05495 [Candidatus Woesearchaeota archaeon]|nr:hypothetical protein [Candidatus Woesearchaeota archaeon]
MNNTAKKKVIIESLMQNNTLVTKAILEDVENNIDRYYQETQPKPSSSKYNVEVVYSYQDFNKKRVVQDFVGHMNARFKQMELILRSRQELQHLTSIARVTPGSSVSIIGLILDKYVTKNEHISLEMEDRSGKSIKVIITKNSKDYSIAKDLSLDQVIGIVGRAGDNVIFASAVLLPDIPLQQQVKQSPDETYVVVLSDTEMGSNNFMHDEFQRFLAWIQGKWGNAEQRRIASKVGYVFVVGDIVAGIGIYPGQETEVAYNSVKQMYDEAALAFASIPKHIPIIMCAGNHDSVRLSEPQPCLDIDHAAALYELPNITMVSNPSWLNIHASEDFSGFSILLYHGMSYPYFADTVNSIRQSGRQASDKTELVMEYLLKCRHLAPSHTSSFYIPDPKHDALVIDSIPDYFLSGHIHKARVKTYRGVNLVVGSCWQPSTQFQQRMGHNPDPCVVPVLNLQNRKITLFDFKHDQQ